MDENNKSFTEPCNENNPKGLFDKIKPHKPLKSCNHKTVIKIIKDTLSMHDDLKLKD